MIHLRLQQVGNPLTQRTSPKLSFPWSPSAQQAFNHLKQLFSSVPILIQVDLNQPFVAEADVSDSGIEAVLSQQLEGKLHPCDLFSHHLTQAMVLLSRQP